MSPDKTVTVLDLLAQMKREALTPSARLLADRIAVEVISHDIGRPMVMADNLNHWLGTDWLSHSAA